MSKLLKWQEEYLDRISKMNNEEVFEEYNDLIHGDDWDGCYTKKGNWQWDEIEKEFYKRLRACGYLPEESK